MAGHGESASTASCASTGCMTDEQQDAGRRTAALIDETGLRTVRMIWVDQHGAARCKFMSAPDYLASLENGIDFSGALLPWTARTTCSSRCSPRAAASTSPSSPASRTWCWCPTRPPSGCCRGPTAPPGCSPTRTSPTASRCRSTARRLLREQVEAAERARLRLRLRARGRVLHPAPRLRPHRARRSGWPPPPPKVSLIEQRLPVPVGDPAGGHQRLVERLRDAFSTWTCRCAPSRTSGARASSRSPSTRWAGLEAPTR